MAVALVPHESGWAANFSAQATALTAAVGCAPMELHHIGSTAIPGMIAKPIIDILGVVTDLSLLDDADIALDRIGYVARGAHGIAGRRYYVRADDGGAHLQHLHVFAHAAPEVGEHLLFRDYLRADDAAADRYARAKIDSARTTRTKQDYQAAKATVIADLLRQAKAWRSGS